AAGGLPSIYEADEFGAVLQNQADRARRETAFLPVLYFATVERPTENAPADVEDRLPQQVVRDGVLDQARPLNQQVQPPGASEFDEAIRLAPRAGRHCGPGPPLGLGVGRRPRPPQRPEHVVP